MESNVISSIEQKQYSTIVIGSGIAGLYTTLKIAATGKKVALITKDKLGESNSRYAQGGVAAVLAENISDSIDLHVKDTLAAGAGLSNPEVTRFISEHGAKVIENLINYGVQFDRNNDNALAMTLEGAHSVRRVLHSGGDATGRNIEKTLVECIKNTPNIDFYEEYQAVELLVNSNKECKGLVVFDINSNKNLVFLTNYTVLATGGLSQVYLNTTNPIVATGDGIALAYRQGAIIQDIEFIQFHPTAFYSDTDVKFLISESVRGEGAKLKNINGELFAHKYHRDADLAPRDIVTRAIFEEMNKTNSDHVYLDATIIPENKLVNRFPNIMKVCSDSNIDIRKDYIPVSPAAHYSMGGIKINVEGKTTICGLYGVGEAACSSLHGANRLASNSLLECVVLAEQVAKDILKNENPSDNNVDLSIISKDNNIKNILQNYFTTKNLTQIPNIDSFIKLLKIAMWQDGAVVRNKDGLTNCLSTIRELKSKFNRTDQCLYSKEYELRNLITISELIIVGALERKESRGGHYREDYPSKSALAKHSYMKKEGIDCIHEFSTEQNNSERICKSSN